jgi:hypothetical protein
MITYQNLNLQEWVYAGCESGRIRDRQVILLASRMDEREALAWIEDIVTGRTAEKDALVFMERAVQSAL